MLELYDKIICLSIIFTWKIDGEIKIQLVIFGNMCYTDFRKENEI